MTARPRRTPPETSLVSPETLHSTSSHDRRTLALRTQTRPSPPRPPESCPTEDFQKPATPIRDLDRHNGAAPILYRAQLASPRFDRQNPAEHLQPLPNQNRHVTSDLNCPNPTLRSLASTALPIHSLSIISANAPDPVMTAAPFSIYPHLARPPHNHDRHIPRHLTSSNRAQP